MGKLCISQLKMTILSPASLEHLEWEKKIMVLFCFMQIIGLNTEVLLQLLFGSLLG